MINGSIQEKKGRLYAVLSIPTIGGRYKQKWVSMGMTAKESKRKQKERLDEIRLEYSKIISIDSLEIKFCDFIKKWNEETKDTKSITTYDGYCHMIDKYIYPYFSEKGFTLAQLRPCDINAYYKWLQRDCGLSGSGRVYAFIAPRAYGDRGCSGEAAKLYGKYRHFLCGSAGSGRRTLQRTGKTGFRRPDDGNGIA